jgi:hypothetical protein
VIPSPSSDCRRAGCSTTRLLAWMLVVAFPTAAGGEDDPYGASAAQSSPPAMRVSGAVAADATWGGTVYLTGSTQIIGATVTVEPGTTIEFVAAEADENPILEVGAPGKTGRLVLQGREDRPIVLRSRPGTKPGAIRVRFAGPPALEWRFVRFESLGYRSNRQKPATPGGRPPEPESFVPSVVLAADSGRGDARFESLRFSRCARAVVQAGADATLSIKRCVFEEGLERLDLDLGGSRSGAFAVLENRFGGVVETAGVCVHLEDNVFIGRRTALSVFSSGAAPARIIGNYVHNTTTEDDGSFCVRCRDADAEMRDNVLRGGTYVVLEGSRRMNGNVLVSAGPLASTVSKSARTHYLVAELPGRADFERNVLIGPAYALLATQAPRPSGGAAEPLRDIVIRHNFFDGMGDTSQAIRLNVMAREPVGATIVENTFIRLPMLVLDEAKQPRSVAMFDRNIIAPAPARPFEGVAIEGRKPGDPGFGGDDRVFDSVTNLELPSLPGALPEDWDQPLLSGTLTIADIRAQVRAAYGLK